VTSTSTTSTPAAYVTPAAPSGGARKTFNWNITWVNAAPDGYMRPMIGVNGVWPPPSIVLNYGEVMILNIYNGLGNESMSLHFHGIDQRNTTFEDGPTFVTQCPIPPGNKFVYQFSALQVGTFWWHGHHAGDYIDGLRGPLIIKNPTEPYGKVDQDITLTLSDHYHTEAPDLIHYYQSYDNTVETGGVEPVPDSNLMNDAQNVQFALKAGQTNLFRIINMGAVAGQYLQFDQHTMTIVEVDGQYVQPYDVQQLFIAVAQRYTVIVKSKTVATQNFAIVATMNPQMFYANSQPASPTVGAPSC
jgi:iron transport multicopper oxidase